MKITVTNKKGESYTLTVINKWQSISRLMDAARKVFKSKADLIRLTHNGKILNPKISIKESKLRYPYLVCMIEVFST